MIFDSRLQSFLIESPNERHANSAKGKENVRVWNYDFESRNTILFDWRVTAGLYIRHRMNGMWILKEKDGIEEGGKKADVRILDFGFGFKITIPFDQKITVDLSIDKRS